MDEKKTELVTTPGVRVWYSFRMSAKSIVGPPVTNKGGPVVVGVDEAGRGALAGPVVAAACVLPEGIVPPVRITDSKQMTPDERQASFDWIVDHCLCGLGIFTAADIDRMGILAATECAMQAAVAEIAAKTKPLYLLIDGRDAFWFDHPHSSIVKGDQLEPCISAASIIAKVSRDKLMTDLDAALPGYGFAVHKGYGTPAHFAVLKTKGKTREHRLTFLGKLAPIATKPARSGSSAR